MPTSSTLRVSSLLLGLHLTGAGIPGWLACGTATAAGWTCDAAVRSQAGSPQHPGRAGAHAGRAVHAVVRVAERPATRAPHPGCRPAGSLIHPRIVMTAAHVRCTLLRTAPCRHAQRRFPDLAS